MVIELPKGYLSYSSMSLWKRDPDTYRRRYYEKEPYFSTPYTEFGNKVGKALETGEFFDPILEQVPRLSEPEHEIEVEVAGVPFKMYLDSFDPKTFEILEYKTGIKSRSGEAPWDRVKVRKHTQLPIYTLGVYLKYGTYNPNIRLVWMETKWSTIDQEQTFGSTTYKQRVPGLKLTGHVEEFPREIREWELERMEKLIRQTAEEITEDYKLWQKTNSKPSPRTQVQK